MDQETSPPLAGGLGVHAAALPEARAPQTTSMGEREIEAQLLAAYEAHKSKIYAVAMRYSGGDSAFAEDVLQDVFVKLWRHLPSLKNPDDVGGWLYRVASNECLHRLRKRRFRQGVRRVMFGEPDPAPPPGPEQTAGDKQRAAAVFRHLDAVPPKARVAFCAHHLDGLTLVEVGEILGHSKGYVSKLVKKAETIVRQAAEGER